MKMTSKINPIFDKIIEEAKDKNIKFNERAPNNLFLTNPFISFLKCFLTKPNNDFNSFNLETLPKEFLDQCFEEDEHLKFRTLYFKNNNLQLFTMKDVLNKLNNLFDNDFLKYLKDNFGNITIKEMYSMIYNSIIDSEKEKERIEKFTKIVTTEMNPKVKLELDAKDLYLLSLFIEKQNHIHCKAIFIINFLLESFIRGNNDAYYKLLEFADLRNEKLNDFTENLESDEVDNLDEEEWLLKLLAQHTLGVIYGCKIRLSKPNKNRSTALFNNVYENYLKIKEYNRDTICKIPQSIICCLAVQQFSISEYNDNFDLLWEGGFKDINSWCLLKLLKLGVDLPHHDIETIKETLESQENVLYLYDLTKSIDVTNYDKLKIEYTLQTYCKRGYAPLFQKLETIYNEKQQYELSNFCNKMFQRFNAFTNNRDEIIQFNIFTTQTQFDHLMIDFPLNPIIINAISKDSEEQVRDSLELLMDQYNEIKLYLIIGPFLNKLNNEWNDLKLKLNELNDNIVKSIINEFDNYTLLKQLLNSEKQDIDSILNYLLQHSNDLNENVKQLLENYFNEKQKEQQVSTSTFINEPSLSNIETNVTSSQLIMIDPRYCCKEHGYPLKYICCRCNDVIVCPECGINSHNGHNLKLINDIITIEINKVKELKQKLENKTQTLQQSLQQVEQSISKVNNQKEHEITKLDQSANNLINAIQKRRDTLKDNLNQKHNERITILENEKTNLTENIQFIQNEVTNININELKNNGIELINKRKELNNFELNKLNNNNSLLSNTFLNTCNQFEIVLSFEEQEWINKINKQFGYVVDGIVNPSLCLIEDIPNIFIKDENYKLKLQLKSEKGNLLKGGYLIKSFILNESEKIDDCKVIDNNDGTYFIEFKCPSVNVELFKLKTLIEDKEMKVHECRVFNYELLNYSEPEYLIEGQQIKINLKSNAKINSYLFYNNQKENFNVINNNNTYIIEFKCPSNPFKLFTIIEGKEIMLYEYNSVINLINYSEITNYNPDQLLMNKELVKLTLQLKTNNNINYTKNDVNVQSYLTSKDINTKIQDCKVINNNNGTFTIEFHSPSSPFILNTLIEEKKMKLYEFNNFITTELNEYIIENQINKFVLQTNRKNINEIEPFITSIDNDKICKCNLQNNINGTFTIEFKSPLINQNEILLHCLLKNEIIKNSPFKFKIVKSEININNDMKLNYNESNTFTLQFKNHKNEIATIKNSNIQSFIHLDQSNNILVNCNVINNNNGTFNIQFNTPIENKYKSIYLSIKINDYLLNNIPFTFLPNNGISYHQFDHYKTIGSNYGRLYNPKDIKFDEKDNLIFIADKNNSRIQVFDVEGNYKYQLKTPSYPCFIAIDYFKEGNEILVGCSDFYYHKIYRFEKKENGKQLQQVIGSGSGSGDDQFNFQYGGMIIDSNNGNIYISDSNNNRIKVYSNAGQLLKIFTNGFQHPSKIDFNSKGNLIIADHRNNKIQILNKEDGNVISTIQHQTYTNQPMALVVDKTNDNIYISNFNNHCISVFDKDGQFIKQFGKHGSGNGEFYSIYALALNSNNGYLYIVEYDNHRMQIFK